MDEKNMYMEHLWSDDRVQGDNQKKDQTELQCVHRKFHIDRFGIEPGPVRWERSKDQIPVEARFFAPVQTGPGAHIASCKMGIGFYPGVKSGRGVTLTPHSLLVPWS
jgi:hypothetical protein